MYWAGTGRGLARCRRGKKACLRPIPMSAASSSVETVFVRGSIMLGCLLLYLATPLPAPPGPPITSRRYAVSTAKLLGLHSSLPPPSVRAAAAGLARSFVQSRRDDTTDRFLVACNVTSWTGRLGKSVRGTLSILLQRLSWSRTDANALVQRFSLFVASRSQLVALLQGASVGAPPQTLLDIGAGTGAMTTVLATALGLSPSHVTGLEDSAPLRRRLAARGYRAVASLAEASSSRYDAIALLNVLDSCDEPQALLRGAAGVLSADGVILLESVVPFCPRVYKGAWGVVDAHRPPRSPLGISAAFRCRGVKHGPAQGKSFEGVAAGFVAGAVEGLDLEVVAWTRLPYISSGDEWASHVVLDSALFVLRRRRTS